MSAVRVAISRKRRFAIFKRDGFTCQYCGRKPPDVVLEIDHIVALASDGSNEEHNLLTACFDCNRGKSDDSLTVVKTSINIEEKRRLIEERREQVKAYEEVLRVQREEMENKIDAVIAVYDYYFEDIPQFYFKRTSIKYFLEKLPLLVVQEAMELACERMQAGNVFRYFCGVCWNKIRPSPQEES